jgi:hypothetical protein
LLVADEFEATVLEPTIDQLEARRDLGPNLPELVEADA